MARTATGVDIGLRTAKVLRGHVKDSTFVVTEFATASYSAETVTEGWGHLAANFKLGTTRVGLTGREVNIRYTRVPRVPDWQLRKLMRFEVAEIGDQSGSEVASDFNVLPELPEIEGEDVVLLGMARESLLAEHLEGVGAHGGTLDAFTPNAIALYNAWLHYGVVMEDTVMVANIGHDNIDVILVRGTDLLFARNMSGGSGLFDQAIAERFGVGLDKAEAIKLELATLEPGASFSSANAEKASRALMGPAGQLLSLLESTVLFCKSQMKLSGLRVDRVMLTGGGAALKGFDRYLAGGMNMPVELFDPFRVVDTTKLDPHSAEQLEEYQLEAVVALGLATTASDSESYSIEILPAAMKRRREFWGGTAFLVAAAVLALVWLGYYASVQQSSLSNLETEVASKKSLYRRADGDHRRTLQLVAENERKAELARELFQLKGAGEQLARVLREVDAHLPPDFWLTEASSTLSYDEQLGVPSDAHRPIVRLRGRAREGTEAVTAVFNQLAEGLRAALGPEARLRERMFDQSQGFQIDLTLLAEPVETEAADEASAEED